MTDTIENALAKVYDLIELNELEEARAILKTLLETDRDNPDVWWLYAHSVTEPETARMALNSVLHLDPDYPQVKELLGRLNLQIGENETIINSDEPQFIQSPALPVLQAKVRPINQITSTKTDNSSDTLLVATDNKAAPFRPGFLLLIGLLAAILTSAVGIIWLVNRQPPVDSITLPLTETSEVSPLDELSSLATVFASFTVQGDGIVEKETNLGRTLIIHICTVPGREMRSTLQTSMDLLAHNTNNIEAIEAIGVQVWDCSTDTLLRFIAAPSAVSRSYVNNEIDQQNFEAQWIPVG
jgi:hypothetical protein